MSSGSRPQKRKLDDVSTDEIGNDNSSNLDASNKRSWEKEFLDNLDASNKRNNSWRKNCEKSVHEIASLSLDDAIDYIEAELRMVAAPEVKESKHKLKEMGQLVHVLGKL